jgi:hypothetical protein
LYVGCVLNALCVPLQMETALEEREIKEIKDLVPSDRVKFCSQTVTCARQPVWCKDGKFVESAVATDDHTLLQLLQVCRA